MATKVNLEDPGPPLTLEEISAFEDEIGGRLPDDYKQFLLAHNGGLVEPPLGIVWEGKIEEVGGFNELSSIPDCGLRLSLGKLRDLNAAVGNVRTELIEKLIEAGADVNERNEFGETPLKYVPGTALPGEEGDRNRELRDLLIRLGAVA